MNPASGSAGTSQTTSSTPGLALHQPDVVGGRAGAAPENGHDDAEADDDLSGGDDEREEHDRPDRRCRRACGQKVTKVRLTALSMSSTHMNITSTLRRMSRPTAPMVNSTAARIRYYSPVDAHDVHELSAAGAGAGAAGQHDGADDRDDEQHRRDLEGEQVAGEDRLGEPFDVGAGALGGRPGNGRLRPVAQSLRVSSRTSSTIIPPSAIAIGRWPRSGLCQIVLCRGRRRCSMITNRKSTTMAPGVDDHLHGGEEVGALRHEQHGDAEQRHHQHERGVHRVAGQDDAQPLRRS